MSMQVLGYIASFFIGISLGLIGGGGSILTVPVLVYLFQINPILSTSYSLFIVGTTSFIGAIDNYNKNLVKVRVAFLFSLTSIITVFITRKFIIPLIPEKIGTIGNFTITHELITMVLFAVLMLIAARAMIISDSKTNNHPASRTTRNRLKLLCYGIAVGLATGILGAGGGFLLIPTLVIFVGLPMKKAVGTSLLIIALNSLVGFAADLGHFGIDWIFLVKITFIAIAGIFSGGLISRQAHGEKLKKSFGWFVFVMGIFILINELLLNN